MIVAAESRLEAIEKSGLFVGQVISGMQIVKIEARIILPDVYEVTFDLGPINNLFAFLDMVQFVFYA